MFYRLFHKKAEVRCKSVDDYCVIEPTDIRKMKTPPFDVSHYLSEKEYRDYLESVQPLIEEYALTKKIRTIPCHSLEDVKLHSEENQRRKQFLYSFLSCGNHINVKKHVDGTYSVASNGSHRMYVAKKYGFKLLVHVSDEEYTV